MALNHVRNLPSSSSGGGSFKRTSSSTGPSAGLSLSPSTMIAAEVLQTRPRLHDQI
ncbi:hypothetical protein Fmac_000611 [Flemingia macrophylla]|uniref:Uncharacterized protein n=1 Tax=Flemingia macrophylla TaxID=520843 RepID=A0ABD1NEW0_9FABA